MSILYKNARNVRFGLFRKNLTESRNDPQVKKSEVVHETKFNVCLADTLLEKVTSCKQGYM